MLILFSSITAFSQAKDSTEVVKPRVFSRPVPIVEYEIVQTVTKTGNHLFEVITKLYILRERQDFFEIFAVWQNLARQPKGVEAIKTYHKKLVEKELKLIGHHE